MVTWRLKEIAAPERWNAHTLAEATGLNYMTVHGIWTNKTRRADLDTMEKLARVLKIQPGELLSMSESANG
jgi:DNA-binding Xre family transcriptional regulator